MMMMPPSAIAGNRVNRECYMQVHERGCTTPALVRFSVTGYKYIYMYVEMISVNNHCTTQIIWKIGKLQTKGYGCHT